MANNVFFRGVFSKEQINIIREYIRVVYQANEGCCVYLILKSAKNGMFIILNKRSGVVFSELYLSEMKG